MFKCPQCNKFKMQRSYIKDMPSSRCGKCKNAIILGLNLKKLLTFNKAKTKSIAVSDFSCPACHTKMNHIIIKGTNAKQCPKCSLSYFNKNEIEKLEKQLNWKLGSLDETQLQYKYQALDGLDFLLRYQAPKTKEKFAKVSLIIAAVCLLLFREGQLVNELILSSKNTTIFSFLLHPFVNAKLSDLLFSLFIFYHFTRQHEKSLGSLPFIIILFLSTSLLSLSSILSGLDVNIGLHAFNFISMGSLYFIFPQSKVQFIEPVIKMNLMQSGMMSITASIPLFVLLHIGVHHFYMSYPIEHFLTYILSFVFGYICHVALKENFRSFKV